MKRLAIALVLAAACSGGKSNTPTPPPGSDMPTPTEPPPTDPGSGYTTPPADAGSGPQQGPADAGSGPQQGPADGGGAPSGGGPKLHAKCGPGDSCGEGTCVTYYGIAGPRGPQFKTCEIKCDKTTKCPTGTKCSTVADGPGQVCN